MADFSFESVVVVTQDTFGAAEGLIGCLPEKVNTRIFRYAELSPKKNFFRRKGPGTHPAFSVTMVREVLPHLRSAGESLLIIMKGGEIDLETLISIRELPNCSIFEWAYDSVERYPALKLLAKTADLAWFCDGDDVESFSNNGAWMPLGFDESVFVDRGSIKRDIDVLVVGSIGAKYEKRRSFLNKLANSTISKSTKCCFVGTTGTRIRDAFMGPSGRVSWIAKRLSICEVAGLMSRAKIVVNIHQDDGGRPVNPLFFAVPATGACEVTDERHYLSEWMEPGKDYVACSERQLISVVEELLSDSERRKKIAEHGKKTVLEHHTFKSRLNLMIQGLRNGKGTS